MLICRKYKSVIQILSLVIILTWLFSSWSISSQFYIINDAEAAVLSTLRPNGDGTTSGTLGYSSGSTAYTLIDDDPDSPNTSDYIYNGTTAAVSTFVAEEKLREGV